MRVLPLDVEDINQCWLSDKDRFAYEGLNSDQRLTRPMLKQDGEWLEVDWQTALEYVINGLKQIRQVHGADSIGALATPHQTVEELYLLQKFMRALGTGNVDARLRQSDFSLDGSLAGAPWLGMPVNALDKLQRVLVVGSNLRHDHPLLALRLRQAVKHGAQLNLVNPTDDDLLTKVANKAIVAPQAMVNVLAQIVVALAEFKQTAVPVTLQATLAGVEVSPAAQAMATSLAGGERRAVLLGNLAQHHANYADLHVLAQAIADLADAHFGFLGEAANSVGAYVAGAVANKAGLKAGLNAAAMLAAPRKAYLLLGAEPELDCQDAAAALAAMRSADMVVAMSAYKHAALDYADVLLPIAPFSETSGTYISTEGRVQSFNGAVKPLGETRPAWKVLRVLGTLLGLPGFDFDTSEAVRKEVLPGTQLPEASLNNRLAKLTVQSIAVADGLVRVGEVPMYQADAIVRRAESLQATRDAVLPVATMHSALLARLAVPDGSMVTVRQGAARAIVRAQADDRLPDNCVRLPVAHALTASLGAMLGEITVERA
jgi:NADH-quinone oxidoreductase subunit G